MLILTTSWWCLSSMTLFYELYYFYIIFWEILCGMITIVKNFIYIKYSVHDCMLFPHCFPLVEFHLLGHMSVGWTLIVYNFTPFLVHFLLPKCEWRCDHCIPHPAPCCCVFPNNMDSPFGTRSQNELLLSKGPFAHDFFNHSNKD